MTFKAWTPDDDAVLDRLYPIMDTAELAKMMGRTRSSVKGRAGVRGIKKSQRQQKRLHRIAAEKVGRKLITPAIADYVIRFAETSQTPRISNATTLEPYSGVDLWPSVREGAMQAQEIPSRYGNVRVYRDGRREPVEA